MVRIHHEIDTENLSGHLVIYGWNSHYKVLIEELRGEGLKDKFSILIINIDSDPLLEALGSEVYLLNSLGNYEINLKAANVARAGTLIIAPQFGIEEKHSSSQAILICILAKKMNPDIRVIVDVPFGNEIQNLFNAGVDEVLCGEQFCSMLIANTVINEGISPFFREILSTRYGNEFYLVKFTPSFYGKTFVSALEELKEKQNTLLLAVVRGKNIYTNPQFLTIEKEDYAIVLTEQKVESL